MASAGQYSAAYLGIAYGGKKPAGIGSDLGTPIQLADGQTFSKVVIALPRGSVITGRVTDEMGEPLSRVQVYTIFFPPGVTRGQRTGSGGQTDDLGQFRLFGLRRAITPSPPKPAATRSCRRTRRPRRRKTRSGS